MISRKNILKFTGTTLFIFISLRCLPQLISPNPSFPAAGIALNQHGIDVSNDLFNGKERISIPLYECNYEGISIPINLSYVGGNGIKPDELPSWVGSGWNLSAGGYINRIVRGRPDEVRDFTTVVYNINNNPFPPIVYKKTFLNNTNFSYFTNYNKVSASNWSTQSYVSTLFTGSNTTYTENYIGETRTFYNASPRYDLVPDEFSFSIGDISGKFYFDHTGNWIVASNDGKKYAVNFITGEQVIKDYISQSNNEHIIIKAPNIIKYFTLTSSDGIEYYFGNTNTNALLADQYFDYSHSSVFAQYPTQIGFNTVNGVLLTDVVPTTWHLTKIENLKTGSQITLEYSQNGIQCSESKQAWGRGAGGPGQVAFDQLVYEYGQIVYTNPDNPSSYYLSSPLSNIANRNWTLTKINFPNSFRIEFNSTASTQLSTDWVVASGYFGSLLEYNDFTAIPNFSSLTNSLIQLNSIYVKFNSELKKQIKFNYNNSSSNRLQLVSVVEQNVTNSEFIEKVKFNYNNSVPLPSYGVAKNDHWGFYNNKDFFSLEPPPLNSFSKLSLYSSYREPDVNFAGAEMLSKITYPTKGFIQLTYEPNMYSKKKVGLNSITNIGNNLIGGGLRTKKISYYNENSQLQYEKNFDYTIPGSNLSSGVLGIPPKEYLKGTSAGYLFKAEGTSPIYYSGNAVTYTYASESILGHGKTKYEYTNYDNGFNDGAQIESNINSCTPVLLCDGLSFGFDFSNKNFKRGQLISKTDVNEIGSTIKESKFYYTHNNSEADKAEIRSIYMSNAGSFYSTVSDRVYSDLLTGREEKEFSNATLTQASTLTYDIYGNVKESKSTDSKGSVFKKRYKYAYEYPTTGSDQISLGINKLIQKSCKNVLVEEIETKEDANGSNVVVLSATLYTYGINSAFAEKVYKIEISTPIPFSSFVQSTIQSGNFVKDGHYPSQAELSFDLYDPNGNLLQKTSRSGVIESRIWGYNNTYPVAIITGADYATASSYVSTTASQAIIQNPTSDQQLADKLNDIRTGLANTNAQVITYTYSPLIGQTRKIDANNHTTYYEYDGFGRVARILDENHNIIKAYEYHLKN